VQWHSRIVTTGIYKQPIAGRIALRKLNLDVDGRADLTVHGGEAKAVYCYPLEHYDYWKAELPDHSLPMGVFGENFTTEGLLENEVFLGDRFSIGSAEVVGDCASARRALSIAALPDRGKDYFRERLERSNV
jgi:MOSC domain-containing protein YiiM